MALGLGGNRDASHTGYSGPEGYKFIDRLLKNGRGTLRVVSPYIGSYYAKMLVDLAKQRKVYVITSATQKPSEGQQDAVRILQDAGRKKANKKLIAYFILIIALSFFVGTYRYQLSIAISLVFLAVLYIELVRKKHPKSHANLYIKVVTKKFVHEKLYISDGEAIIGSANLTYSGTHKNIEHIELIKDEASIRELSDHFDRLWSE